MGRKRKAKRSKSRFPKGQKYDYMAKYAQELGHKNVSDAVKAFGNGRKFRNAFKKWIRYKRLKNL